MSVQPESLGFSRPRISSITLSYGEARRTRAEASFGAASAISTSCYAGAPSQLICVPSCMAIGVPVTIVLSGR
jgi:hypothetical protein